MKIAVDWQDPTAIAFSCFIANVELLAWIWVQYKIPYPE